MNVFLSYASEDRSTADAIAVGLRQDGHDVFFDRDDLPPGDGYHNRIRQAIERADLFLFLVSPESLETSSYAMTELGLARERWPNPSGRVLPVIVRHSSISDMPPYLRAVTVLEPRGDLVAEVLAQVAKYSRGRGQWRKRIVYAAVGLCAMGVGAGVARDRIWPPTAPAPCYLKSEIRDVRHGSSAVRGMMLDVSHQGATSSFLVSDQGFSAIHVGPLDPHNLAWTIQLKSADGVVVGQQNMEGCLDTTRTLSMGKDIELVVGPR